MPAMASGFCYVNDIVLGILELTSALGRVLYLDVDVHHGDGVEHAFKYSSEVFTLSFHRHGPGFFPGTGAIVDSGKGEGAYCNLNVPLSEGITDGQYTRIFSRVLTAVVGRFKPKAVVMQCGCDSLAPDKLGGGFNLTSRGLASCLAKVLALNLPTLLLGGGGYDPTTVSRCWTLLLATAAKIKLNSQIPEHQLYERYSPTFNLHTQPVSTRPNLNTKSSLAKLAEDIRMFLARMQATAVGQHEMKTKDDDAELGVSSNAIVATEPTAVPDKDSVDHESRDEVAISHAKSVDLKIEGLEEAREMSGTIDASQTESGTKTKTVSSGIVKTTTETKRKAKNLKRKRKDFDGAAKNQAQSSNLIFEFKE
uniref:Histone deacetylase 8 n=1 Tax=Lotharella oceanica TaxID=641309 RepID=A0A7S2TLG1_9EUKA|mmetsp:Transcript_19747/g.37141  ORF Transcript_19747/g.37141 Transcript_19747/m.37141 type:complete len:366 (+) Transcript_19747:404-1501(+)|eukprot:CAMPEP_0170188572 /NCGR_PEP_ID=MMETSP0040_2-20121228/44699_1 /TAXON_ID=641309 /ORGANISM="Lotharella oceanica, Strain CCMP622" /LENGTH=365 /DNA_ID=CAMNT_0010435897 /DNA_START=393 /DNA_END=1490 /DNA_ORIENTATION=-